MGGPRIWEGEGPRRSEITNASDSDYRVPARVAASATAASATESADRPVPQGYFSEASTCKLLVKMQHPWALHVYNKMYVETSNEWSF